MGNIKNLKGEKMSRMKAVWFEIKTAALARTTSEIRQSILAIGGAPAETLAPEMHLVRVGLIEAYAEREGTAAADNLMDELGM